MSKMSIRVIELPGIVYCMEWYGEHTELDIMALENACRRYAIKNPDVTCFIAGSDTESKTARKEKIFTGKRGRPKIIVNGKKVRAHVHIGAIGSNGASAKSFLLNVSKVLNKRAGKKVTKVYSMTMYEENDNGEKELVSKGAKYIVYCHKQANFFHTIGNYDLSQFKDYNFIEKI